MLKNGVVSEAPTRKIGPQTLSVRLLSYFNLSQRQRTESII